MDIDSITMRQAIVTKYLGPTNHKGARVKASAQAGSVTIPWDHALDVEANHTAAARYYLDKHNWSDEIVGGAMPDDTGYCFVIVPNKGGK